MYGNVWMDILKGMLGILVKNCSLCVKDVVFF